MLYSGIRRDGHKEYLGHPDMDHPGSHSPPQPGSPGHPSSQEESPLNHQQK